MTISTAHDTQQASAPGVLSQLPLHAIDQTVDTLECAAGQKDAQISLSTLFPKPLAIETEVEKAAREGGIEGAWRALGLIDLLERAARRLKGDSPPRTSEAMSVLGALTGKLTLVFPRRCTLVHLSALIEYCLSRALD